MKAYIVGTFILSVIVAITRIIRLTWGSYPAYTMRQKWEDELDYAFWAFWAVYGATVLWA